MDATGFDLAVPDDVPETRYPTSEEMRCIRAIDPLGLRMKEIPNGVPSEEES